MIQQQIAAEPYAIYENGIAFNDSVTFEEWRSCLESISKADSKTQWRIGDCLNYGETKWGEKYKSAIEETGYAYQTLAIDKYVCSKIDFFRRRKNLSFGHHAEVASYKSHDQDILLEKAEKLGLSLKKFREIKDSLLPPKGIQPGHVWKLGRHLLYCGNSATHAFSDLCDIAEPSFAFADPPYNAGVAEWDTAFTWQHDYLIKLAPIVAVTPGISAIKDFMQTTSMPYKWSMSYWINNGMTRGALGFGNWIYVALFTENSLHRNEQDWEKVSDLEISITGGDHDPLKHKGRKPIAMMRHIIDLFTEEGQTVIDSFLGSGTTLIACEELGRSCIGAELNVDYCESIVRRWERHTGQEAERWQ